MEGGAFDPILFQSWIDIAKQLCEASRHIRIAQSTIGSLLIHAPADTDLWIHKTIANEINKEGNSGMHHAYFCSELNSRGAYFVDPTRAPEKALAKKYNDKVCKTYHILA